MPNHVTSELRVDGAPDEVRRFFEAIDGGLDENGDPLLIDFNKILPMPESLNIESGSRNDAALDYYVIELAMQAGFPAVGVALGDYAGSIIRRLPESLERRKDYSTKDMAEMMKFGKQLFGNIRDHGAPTWYEWRNMNWGTKWNAYSQDRIDDNTLRFDTAWSGVPDFIQRLSAKYPDLTLYYAFADENRNCNTGEFTFCGGEIDYEYRPENGSPGAVRIANKILGPLENENGIEAGEDEDDWEDEI